MAKQTVDVVLTVKAPANMPPERVAELLKMCIDIGLNDASETADDPEWESDDAKEALKLKVKKVTACARKGE